MTTLSLALVGCGAHSESAHAMPLAHFVERHPGKIRLAAACDLNRERAARFCREYGFQAACAGLEEVLARVRPDAVVSVLPPEKTAEVGRELLGRGIPCLLEKPPGASLAEATRLAELAGHTGAPHMVSMNRRFSPYLHRAIEWAKQSGPLRFVRAQMLRDRRREDDFLWGTGLHVVDAVSHIGGAIERFEVARLDGAAGSTPWFAIAVRFRSGLRARVEIFPTAGVVDETFELAGDDYRARVRTLGAPGESVRCWRNGALEVAMSASAGDPLFLRNGSWEETSAFIRCLRDGAPLHPSLEDVLPALRICGQAAGEPPGADGRTPDRG